MRTVTPCRWGWAKYDGPLVVFRRARSRPHGRGAPGECGVPALVTRTQIPLACATATRDCRSAQCGIARWRGDSILPRQPRPHIRVSDVASRDQWLSAKPEDRGGASVSTAQEPDPVTATVAAPELAAARFQSVSARSPMNIWASGDSSRGSSQTTLPRRAFRIEPIVVSPLRSTISERQWDFRLRS
jgi:hypothetical protein